MWRACCIVSVNVLRHRTWKHHVRSWAYMLRACRFLNKCTAAPYIKGHVSCQIFSMNFIACHAVSTNILRHTTWKYLVRSWAYLLRAYRDVSTNILRHRTWKYHVRPWAYMWRACRDVSTNILRHDTWKYHVRSWAYMLQACRDVSTNVLQHTTWKYHVRSWAYMLRACRDVSTNVLRHQSKYVRYLSAQTIPISTDMASFQRGHKGPIVATCIIYIQAGKVKGNSTDEGQFVAMVTDIKPGISRLLVLLFFYRMDGFPYRWCDL